MSNRLRFRSGQVHLVRLRVESDTVIEAGDLVYLDDDNVKPASDFPWTSDLATTQSAFAAQFLGVAQQPSAAGDTTDISVDLSPSSIYEFQVASGTYEVGDELGPDSGSSVLLNQQLEAVASGTLGIARAAEYKPAAATNLRVSFASAFYPGSANVNAALG
ncbi:MAG: hypothetical protein ACKVT0_06625 [Planctomycetaceae bacterium]